MGVCAVAYGLAPVVGGHDTADACDVADKDGASGGSFLGAMRSDDCDGKKKSPAVPAGDQVHSMRSFRLVRPCDVALCQEIAWKLLCKDKSAIVVADERNRRAMKKRMPACAGMRCDDSRPFAEEGCPSNRPIAAGTPWVCLDLSHCGRRAVGGWLSAGAARQNACRKPTLTSVYFASLRNA